MTVTPTPALLRFAALALALSLAPLLQGCFPVVVAGAGTAALVATDRRPLDVMLGDERIELTAGRRISELAKDQAHVNVTSFNQTLLLTGEAVSAKIKADIEKAVAEIPQVKSVVNELQIAGPSSFASRSNDTYLTGRVKAAFLAAGKFSANDVKVTTEDGVVHLMGLVTRKEADDATDVARSISGVKKVVRVFEYITAPPKPAATESSPKQQ
jgi:osmotically-inducible protein OsmY